MINGKLEDSEIKEGNELILKFEGFTKCLEEDAWINNEQNLFIKTDYIQYHLAYGSLMPVVEKIGKLRINGYTPFIEITNHGCSITTNKEDFYKTFRGCHGETMLIDIWIVIVEFLDWYLKIKK